MKKDLIPALEERGCEVTEGRYSANALHVKGRGILESDLYKNGLFSVQDEASQLVASVLAPEHGDTVIDVCAAPGGKSFAAAICMENRGTLQSCDIHPHKINLIRRGAERLGLSCITAAEADASVPKPEWARRFDLVLADVPCSGLCVIRKKPDIRDKDLSALSALPEIQMKILAAQASHVKPGGVLLYSTCTVLKRENEDVAAAFAASHPAFRLEAFVLPGGISAPEGRCTLLPCDQGTDGFFIAKFRRES
jgi:16S rRNA (cytosine967-C5)-methyltransferase